MQKSVKPVLTIATILLSIVIGILIKHAFITIAIVPSSSMEDTLNINDYIIGLNYKVFKNDIQRGDIVLFKESNINHETYVKRVIGLPGDNIVIKKDKIFINGKEYHENYTKGNWSNWANGYVTSYFVPNNSYFLLGDNREISEDSRYFGYIQNTDIYAKAIIKIDIKKLSIVRLI